MYTSLVVRAFGTRCADEARRLTVDNSNNSDQSLQIRNKTLTPNLNTLHLNTLSPYPRLTSLDSSNSSLTNHYSPQLTVISPTSAISQLTQNQKPNIPSHSLCVFNPYSKVGQVIENQYLSSKYQLSPLSLYIDGSSGAGGDLHDKTPLSPTESNTNVQNHVIEDSPQTQNTHVQIALALATDTNQENTPNHLALRDQDNYDVESKKDDGEDEDQEEDQNLIKDSNIQSDEEDADDTTMDVNNPEQASHPQDNEIITYNSASELSYYIENYQDSLERENTNSIENRIDTSPLGADNGEGNNDPSNPPGRFNDNNWNPNNHFGGMSAIKDFWKNAWESLCNLGSQIASYLNIIGKIGYWGAVASVSICGIFITYKALELVYKVVDLAVVKPIEFCYSSAKSIYDYLTDHKHIDHDTNACDSYVIIYKNGKKSHIDKLSHGNDLDEDFNIQTLGQTNVYDEVFEV